MSSHHSVTFCVGNLTILISVPRLWRRYYCCDTGVQHRIDKTEETREQITAINELQCKFAESVYLNGIRLSNLVIKSRMKCIQTQRTQATAYCPRVISHTWKYTRKPIILNLGHNSEGTSMSELLLPTILHGLRWHSLRTPTLSQMATWLALKTSQQAASIQQVHIEILINISD